MKPALPQVIHLQLMPSYLLLGLLSGISIACCWIVLQQAISADIELFIIALIVVSSIYFIVRDALLMLPWSWKVLEVDHNGELTIVNQGGQQFQPALAASCFIHEACTILNFKGSGFKFNGLKYHGFKYNVFRLGLQPVILFSRSKNDNEIRRLRVWLRWFQHGKSHNQEDLTVADLAS